MTETNKQAFEKETQIHQEDIKATAEPSPKTPLKENHSAMFSTTLVAASLVISLAALGTSGWIFYQNKLNNIHGQISDIHAQQNRFATELESHSKTYDQLNKLSEQVANSESHLEEQTAAIVDEQSKQQGQLGALASRIRQIDSATKEDWKLAEAEYLVRLANQRILLESDINGAETLLSNADSILAELEDPMFFDARKAIAKDIQALKSTSHFDVEGRYLQLSALYDQVGKLPQREPSKKWQKENTQDNNSKLQETTSEVGNALSKVWESIKSLVIINYNHKPIKSLLPPTEYQELITGLQLQLDVAQVALVKGETNIYPKALERVATAVTNNFDTNAQSVVAFMTSLTSLQQVNPAPELPLPRDSLAAMKALMKAWNNRVTPSHPADQATPKESLPKAPSSPTADADSTTGQGA